MVAETPDIAILGFGVILKAVAATGADRANAKRDFETDPVEAVTETPTALAEEATVTDPKPAVAETAADTATLIRGVTEPRPVEQEACTGKA